MPVMLPRDLKQVSNTVRNERNKRLLSQDDIVGLYLVNQELKGYVVKLELLPEFHVILISEEMLSKYAILAKEKCIFYYDTTFNLGDFYVSPLTFQTTVFQNNVVSLANLVHHTKKKEVHQSFFMFLK